MSSYMTNVVNYLRIPVIASSGLAVLLSGLLYFKQNEIIYPRNVPTDARTSVPTPNQFQIQNASEFYLYTPDAVKLHAFLVKPSNALRALNITILMFHGNAGNIGYRLPIARILAEELGCNVLLLQYRGYGYSEGNPNEKGLNIDAQTGLDWIRSRPDLKDSKIVIYGQSLGGAVGIGLVKNNLLHGDITGLILENTFTSIRKMIPSAFPPARYLAPLCHQIWPSEEMLAQIRDVPVLFLSGLKDEIVPPEHMKQLFEICKCPKVWHELPEGTHNDTVAEPSYFFYIQDFLREYVLQGQR
ncbi:alpha/beta-hydrolase [Aulographum hederae CBS 113979]|uniref:Alpha/beta-hydrolase n=1 Tax=Aulographum hederae CBS 113979 TaxID=1176131 RepID=A0A6G1H3T0_9PEZI|nr:alpha/beta-hydrolase [Aulographum hederae CBS 113979]